MTAFVFAMVATFVVGLLVLAAVAAVAWRGRRSRIAAEQDEMEQLLRDTFAARLDDTQEFDIVDAAFENYQQSITDILDANSVGRDELIRNLEAATVEWERRKFDVITDSLHRDLRFRLSIRRASRTKSTT